MKTLKIERNPNTMVVANLISETRNAFKNLSKASKVQFSIREVAKKVGCSPLHYEQIEQGKTELTSIKLLYNISATLKIPINHLIQLYFGLFDEEVSNNFDVENNIFYCSYSNSSILTSNATFGKLKYEIADAIGCSKDHYSRISRGERDFHDIRLMYKLSKLLSIPLYVLIRNELGLSDDDMLAIISLPQNKETIKVESRIPKDNMSELRINLIKLIASFSPSELLIASEIISKIQN